MVHRRLLAVALFAVALAACGGGAAAVAPGPAEPFASAAATSTGARDWPMFGVGPQKANVSSAPTPITVGNAHKLRRRTLGLPGTVDSSPIFLHAAKVGGKRRDVVIVTTTYGRTLALSASTGRRLWQFVPRSIGRWQGTAQFSNSSPVADPGRAYVFSTSPDGRIHKLRVSSGREVRTGRWPVSVTRDATHEKLTSPLTVFGGYVIVTTGGYIGDAPPYQGHVLTISRSSGRIRGVFNSLCSERHFVQRPSTCPKSDSAIWSRAGAVVDTKAKEIWVATGNAPWDGRRYWGDSTLVLSFPSLRLKRSWTPRNQAELESTDADLGSTSPALLPGGLAVQGGKAGIFSLLSRARPNGTTHAGPRQGGELQDISTPGGGGVFNAQAVWGNHLFATTFSGTTAYVVGGGRLRVAWKNSSAGTSPVMAGGLLYVFDPGGALDVYRPRSGRRVAHLPAGAGHWNSPIVAGGKVWLPEGNANERATSGTLSVYSLR